MKHPPPLDSTQTGLAGGRLATALRQRGPLFGALLLNLMVAALLVSVIWHGRQGALAEQQSRVGNLARLVELNVSSTLDKVGIALASTVAQIERQAPPSGIDELALRGVVDETALVPEILRISVFDASGRQFCASPTESCPRLDIADREYFQRLKADPAMPATLFGPYVSRIDGKTALVLARALRNRDGSFAGLAGAVVPVATLQALAHAVNVGSDGRSGLRTEDLRPLAWARDAAAPPSEEDAKRGKLSNELRSAIGAGPAEGFVRALSGFDGVDRQTAYRRLPKYPLYVLVALATAEILAPWRQIAGWGAGFLILLALASAVVVRLMQSGLARQQRVQGLLARMTESEDHLRRLYEVTPAMLHAIDLEYRLSIVSDAWLARLGYSREEVIGRKSIDFMSESSRAFVLSRGMEALLKKGYQDETAMQMVTRSGEIIEVLISSVVERSPDGSPRRIVTGIQDVTLRRRAEGALVQERQRLQNIIDGTGAGTWQYNLVTGEYVVNASYAAMLDYSPDELHALVAAESFLALVHPADQPTVMQARRAHTDGRTPAYEVEFRMRHRDGRWLWVFSRGSVFQRDAAGQPVAISGIHLDISVRKEAELALQQRERLMRLVIDAFPGPLAHWDAEMRCTIANRAYVAWMGLDPEHMLGRTQRELLGDEMYARNEPTILAALQGEEQRVERSRLVADGTHRHYFLHYLPDRDGDKVRGFISIVVDVSEMKQVHLELQERTAQAEQASVAKSQFLANMSHEIRTPMNAILGMLALLKKTELTARQADYTGKTEGAARSLLGLLNDILDFSKAEAGKMTLDPHPFCMDQMLRDLAVILSGNVGGKNVEVLFDVDPELPIHLVGDALRLQQVLINLGGNAIKFTEDGEVVVSVDIVASNAESVDLEIAVRDTGIGIAPEQHDRIFNGFTQAEASTTRRFGGTGLGLAICQRLVGLMGGTLQLDSAVGKGSRFHFRITLPRVVDAASETHGDAAGRCDSSLRVLIVDDNESAREVGRRMGRQLGWSADLVDSGEAALAALQAPSARYDAVFVDWQMPGLDGWQTARRIRELPGMAEAPTIVMVTAHGRDSLSTRPPEDQALIEGFLVKPITASMYYDAIVDARSASHRRIKPAKAPIAASSRLVGMRLLVAEDNANNQQVARELLEDEGAEVVVATNGLEALEAVAAADPPFDAVLMDLQMPVMDGYTATSRIRQELAQATLPIIAMTANAMASDREACLSAGMNDHVGKPFDLDHLVAVLLRLADRDAPASAALQKRAIAPLSAAVLRAAEAADVGIEAAIRRLGNNRKVYARTLRAFVADLALIAQELMASSTRSAWNEASRSLHTLKGVAGTVGAMALSNRAGTAETAVLSAVTPDACAAVVRETADFVTAAIPALETLCVALEAETRTTHAESSANLAALDTDEVDALAAMLTSVSRLLADSDLEAIDALKALRAQLPGAAGARLDTLEEAVESLDFEAALARCNDWLKDCVS